MNDRCEHPPGHPESVKLGCTCPVLDNGYGLGSGWQDAHGNPLFWFDTDCPLHGGTRSEPIEPDTVVFPCAVDGGQKKTS